MKAVIISIRPDWIQKIFSGEKTIEVRKTLPKLPPPFKCFIYCTKPRYDHDDFLMTMAGPLSYYWGGGMVVGEFTCDKISQIPANGPLDVCCGQLKGTAMSREEFESYLGWGGGYGWHISDLKVYDKPKHLNDFYKPGSTTPEELDESLCHYCGETDYGEHKMYGTPDGPVFCEGAWCEDAYREYLDDNGFTLTHPPRSWCYVDGGLIG